MKAFTPLLVLLVAGCASAPSSAPSAPLAPAPWSGAVLRATEVSPVYMTEWRAAENRASCALIAFRALGTGGKATARRADFSGGWAVAYDLPDQRSAFGVAGTGSLASSPSYAEWPYTITWRDGSNVGYGSEGGSGPSQLAYLKISNQGCLYNVWSRLGREHLEYLLNELRFVAE